MNIIQPPHTLLVLAVLLLTGCTAPKAQTPAAPPPVPVSVATATQESIPIEISAIGSVEASSIVQVKSQIAGELMSVHFTEGTDVAKGALLFEIDPRPYQEALRQAEAALARDTAQERQAEANLARAVAQSKYADADAARNQELAKAGVVARSVYDQVKSNADAMRESIRADQAAIESARAAIQSDRSAIDKAKLDLSLCEIRSPVTGRAGNLLVNAGNLVQANGDDPLVVIHQIKPVFVSFGVPEDRLAAIRQSSRARKLPVQVSLQGDSANKPIRGLLSVIDNTVDAATGTIRLKATVQNEAGLLWPGQFVNATMTLDTLLNATVIPSEAIQPGQKGEFVYVVKPDQTVEPRNVTVGRTLGRKAIVEKGVAVGETVVIDGQLRLYPGAKIQPVPAGKIDSQPL